MAQAKPIENASYLEPPYRLETFKELMIFISHRTLSIPYSTSLIKKVKHLRISRPPLMDILPDKIDLPLTEVRREYQTIFKYVSFLYKSDYPVEFIESLRSLALKHTGNLPESRQGAYTRLLQQVRDLLPSCRKNIDGVMEHQRENEPISNFLNMKKVLFDTLGEVMKLFLSNRKKIYFEFLEHSHIILCLYDTKSEHQDMELLTHLKEEPVNTSLLLRTLHELFCLRLTFYRNILFRPLKNSLIQGTKKKIQSAGFSYNLAKNLISEMNHLYQEHDNEKVFSRIDSILLHYKTGTEPRQYTKISGLMNNLKAKMKQFNSFYNKNFHVEDIENLYSLYKPHMTEIVLNSRHITRALTLTLYPCKDYHELWKGHISNDCTQYHSRAMKHLTNSRFLNLRIFRNDQWMGNIYVLDYTDQEGTIILDRIQIMKSEQILALDFFQTLAKSLRDNLKGTVEYRILAPYNISNYGEIRKSYKKYISNMPKVQFSIYRTESCFESYGTGVFYRLDGGLEEGE